MGEEVKETKELESKKKYLSRYRNNLYCIKRLEAKLDKVRTQASSVRSTNFKERIAGGIHKTQEDWYCEVLDLEQRIKSLKSKGRNLKQEIESCIDSLTNAKEVEVLELYYIECYSMYDVAKELSYSWRHTERLFSKALNNLVIDIMS